MLVKGESTEGRCKGRIDLHFIGTISAETKHD